MLTASFDTDRSSSAAIHGAVQYDTGQRLKLCGLPGPGEIGCEDERLAGNGETVQVQFAHDGDAQSESLLALWDDGICAWVVGVPDEYLTRSEPVRVYVYIYYGEDDRRGLQVRGPGCWPSRGAQRACAVKTIAQTAVATVGTAAAMGEVNWMMVASAAALSGVLSLLTSVAGLPEVQVGTNEKK